MTLKDFSRFVKDEIGFSYNGYFPVSPLLSVRLPPRRCASGSLQAETMRPKSGLFFSPGLDIF
jgi:hypothetical protein